MVEHLFSARPLSQKQRFVKKKIIIFLLLSQKILTSCSWRMGTHSFLIISRRISWLIGSWVAKITTNTRQMVYKLLIELMNENDVVIKVTAAGALAKVINDLNFTLGDFTVFVSPAVNSFFKIITSLELIPSKMLVLDHLSILIEQADYQVFFLSFPLFLSFFHFSCSFSPTSFLLPFLSSIFHFSCPLPFLSSISPPDLPLLLFLSFSLSLSLPLLFLTHLLPFLSSSSLFNIFSQSVPLSLFHSRFSIYVFCFLFPLQSPPFLSPSIFPLPPSYPPLIKINCLFPTTWSSLFSQLLFPVFLWNFCV